MADPTAGLIDVHAHLGDPVFDRDRAEVLARAREAGITGVIAVTETLEEAERTLELADEHDEVLPAAGLFPTVLDRSQADQLVEWIRARRHRLVAIGEVGLDYWKVAEGPDRDLQHEIFDLFARLALELDLPLDVHSRSAGRPTIERLLELGASRVVLHAFDGRAANAAPGVEAGYFFSVPPSIVRSRQKQKLVRRLPLECLLLETDSPVLGADPTIRNEPAGAIVSLRAIADLHGRPVEEVAERILENQARFLAPAV